MSRPTRQIQKPTLFSPTSDPPSNKPATKKLKTIRWTQPLQQCLLESTVAIAGKGTKPKQSDWGKIVAEMKNKSNAAKKVTIKAAKEKYEKIIAEAVDFGDADDVEDDEEDEIVVSTILDQMPLELFLRIAEYLSTEERLDMAATSKSYRTQIFSTPSLWTNVFGDILRTRRPSITNDVVTRFFGGQMLTEGARAGVRLVNLAFSRVDETGFLFVLRNCPGLEAISIGGFGYDPYYSNYDQGWRVLNTMTRSLRGM